MNNFLIDYGIKKDKTIRVKNTKTININSAFDDNVGKKYLGIKVDLSMDKLKSSEKN